MDMLENIILIMSILWSIGQIFKTRKQVISGEMVIPPLVTAIFVYIVFIVLVIVFNWSPFHLLWMFFISFILGFILMLLPPVQKITMQFLAFLATSDRELN